MESCGPALVAIKAAERTPRYGATGCGGCPAAYPRTLADQAFELIRERIPSTAIPALAPRSHPNRGYYVPALSATEAEEVFALRLKIEPDAAAQASLAATEAERQQAKAALVALEAMASINAEAAVAHNRAFHLALVRPGGRHVTAQLVERLHALAERNVHKHLEPAGRSARAQREHRALLKAWLARDVERIATLLSRHIAATLENLRAQLRQDETLLESGTTRRKRPPRGVAPPAG
jgi:hypothetical protein